MNMGRVYQDFLEREIQRLTDHSFHLGETPNSEIAKQISDMRYDGLSDLLKELVLKLNSDAGNDFRRSRPQLASHLVMAAVNLSKAQREIQQAWEICKPHMKQET
jgi:hypothetical protein